MTFDGLWRAVESRSEAADGLFVYAVTSTGVFCRPTCGSRLPRRERVRFFPTPAMAVAAGFRACKRCRPETEGGPGPAVSRVEAACRAVASRPDAAWTPPRLARAASVSVPQLQRAFRRTLGLSPRDYVAACRRRRFLAALKSGRGVTGAIYEAGYGSPSRVYGAAVTLPGMTPATYGKGGRGATIEWTTVGSRVGLIVAAATAKGACFVGVVNSTAAAREAVAAEFPRADVREGRSPRVRAVAAAAKAAAEARPVPAGLPLDIAGTAFEWRVWRALTKIPRAETRTYTEVARAIAQPRAARAVARACAANPIALLVPCHRVVPQAGGVGGYRWGPKVKEQLT